MRIRYNEGSKPDAKEFYVMKKAFFCILLCVTLLLPATCFAAGDGLAAAEDILKQTLAANFTVLHTGDINGQEQGGDTAVGYAKLAALSQSRQEESQVLLLDSGNALAGDGGKTIQLMEAAQYTAAAIGTRDAGLGIERLQELSARANFPLLCANWLRVDGEQLFEPYAIVEVAGIRVGIIGLISPSIAEEYPDITQGCNVYKPSGIANIFYDEMVEQGCSYFIALTSLGYDGDYTPRDLGKESPWINLILDSNTGTVLDMGELIDQTNVVAFNLEPGFAQVGEYDVTTGNSNGMNTLYPAVYTAQDVKDLKADRKMEQLVASEYVEPSQEVEQTGDGNGTVTITDGGSGRMVYLLCFVGILVLTVAIILVMSRKSAAKGKKK